MGLKIEVYVTKSGKFRAKINNDGHIEEVTVGGERWDQGKGGAFKSIILSKCDRLLLKLTSQLNNLK